MDLDSHDFEDEVRRIARQMWPQSRYDGAAMIAGEERDGVFVTDEMVHLIECTTSRQKAKAFEDVESLVRLAVRMRAKYPTKGVKCWFITQDEPTADQRSTGERHKEQVVILSFSQFKNQLINISNYLEARKDYPFGSMVDPENNSTRPNTKFKYINLDMVAENGEIWNVKNVVNEIINGQKKRFLLLGDYGAGKSTTLREIFILLSKAYRKSDSSTFPILLNLRDHHAQVNTAEALERHARYIGYPTPSHLVRAWRSGMATLILDGFDEIATSGWTGQSKRLRDIRYNAMKLIRMFMDETPPDSGIILAGRTYFFDSKSEMQKALNIPASAIRISLSDFNEQQMTDFLANADWKSSIPAWLPSRPLLLGYLASKKILGDVISESSNLSPENGWNKLLDLICERESKIEAGIDGETVRQIIERLATKARESLDGLGRLQEPDLIDAFRSICGYPPDDLGMVLVQRLPGLGVQRQDDGSRCFIDQDFAEVAKAGDVIRFIDNPFSFSLENASEWQSSLGQLGVRVSAKLCNDKSFTAAKLSAALAQVKTDGQPGALRADIVQIMQELKFPYHGKPIFINETTIPSASFGNDGIDFSHISYCNCLFNFLELPLEVNVDLLPKFNSCMFSSIEGRISENDMPSGKFDKNCTFEHFERSTTTNAAILDLNLPLGVRVMLTVLKKLYLQSGSGRRESALYRGMDQQARAYVPEVLHVLTQAEMAIKVSVNPEPLWLPVRAHGTRVRQLIAAPTNSVDPILNQFR